MNLGQRIKEYRLEPRTKRNLTASAILGVYENFLDRHKDGQDIAVDVSKCLNSDLLIMTTRRINIHTVITRSECLYIAVAYLR